MQIRSGILVGPNFVKSIETLRLKVSGKTGDRYTVRDAYVACPEREIEITGWVCPQRRERVKTLARSSWAPTVGVNWRLAAFVDAKPKLTR